MFAIMRRGRIIEHGIKTEAAALERAFVLAARGMNLSSDARNTRIVHHVAPGNPDDLYTVIRSAFHRSGV